MVPANRVAELERETPVLREDRAGFGMVEAIPLALQIRFVFRTVHDETCDHLGGGLVGKEERDAADVVEEAGEKGRPDLDPARHACELFGGDGDSERMVPELLRPRAGAFVEALRAGCDHDVAGLPEPDGDDGFLQLARRIAATERRGVGDFEHARREPDVGLDHATELVDVGLGVTGHPERGARGGGQRWERSSL